jgi:hypothetical protein
MDVIKHFLDIILFDADLARQYIFCAGSGVMLIALRRRELIITRRTPGIGRMDDLKAHRTLFGRRITVARALAGFMRSASTVHDGTLLLPKSSNRHPACRMQRKHGPTI